MNRREFVAFVGGMAGWPVVAHAQQTATPLVGFLSTGSQESDVGRLTALRQGLKETGYVDQTVAIEYRGALGQYDRLPALARWSHSQG